MHKNCNTVFAFSIKIRDTIHTGYNKLLFLSLINIDNGCAQMKVNCCSNQQNVHMHVRT